MILQDSFPVLFTWLNQYIELASFTAPIVSSEAGVLALGFLCATDSLPILKVIFFSFLSMLMMDSFWFFLIRLPFFQKIKRINVISKKYKQLERRVESVSGKNDVLILLISKILIGTRIMITVYISLRKFSYRKFIAYDLLPTLLWATTLATLGWFAGAGYYSLAKVTSNLYLLSLTVTIGIIIFYLILIGTRKLILEKK
jgi:membrane protein DedA with SNARE-associated domain